jgi:hypothetical protein
MPSIVAKADRVFAEQGEGFRQLFHRELAEMRSIATETPGEAAAGLREASRRLSVAIGREDGAARRRIGISQLHMTANRLGLNNPEEVYLSRILSNRIAEILSAGSESGAELREALTRSEQRRATSMPDWRELLCEEMLAVREGS